MSGDTFKIAITYCILFRLTVGPIASNLEVLQMKKCLEVEENRVEM